MMRALFTQQGPETRLHEMLIGGEGFADVHLPHHLEGKAVRERPFLVGAGAIERDTTAKPFVAGGDDADLRGGRQISGEIREPLPMAGGGQRVTDFHENPGGGYERSLARLAPAHGRFVPLILGIEQREEVRGVGEGHDVVLGAPWR